MRSPSTRGRPKKSQEKEKEMKDSEKVSQIPSRATRSTRSNPATTVVQPEAQRKGRKKQIEDASKKEEEPPQKRADPPKSKQQPSSGKKTTAKNVPASPSKEKESKRNEKVAVDQKSPIVSKKPIETRSSLSRVKKPEASEKQQQSQNNSPLKSVKKTRKQQVANGKNNASVDFSKEDAANDEEVVEAEPQTTTNDSKQALSVQNSTDERDEKTKTSDENVLKPASQTPTSLKTSRTVEASRSASDEVVFIDTRGSVQLTNYLLGNAIKFSKAVTSARPSSKSAA